MKRISYIMLVVLVLMSCNIDDVITTNLPPEIILDNSSRVYTTKVDRPLTIAPQYENVADATYQWSIEGGNYIIDSATQPSLTFETSAQGCYYVTLTVTTDYGADEEEMRIDVVEREIPTISLVGADQDYTIAVGDKLTFAPVVKETSIPTTHSWNVNGNKVSDELNYTFIGDEVGEYNLVFVAENEDGSDSVSLTIVVCNLEDMPFAWSFAQTVYNYAKGRSVCIKPTTIINGTGAVYTWSVDGEIVYESELPEWICAIDSEGTYQVTATATIMNGNSQVRVVQELCVNVCPAEGTYYRQASAASSAHWNKVYEYTPAPGQFINETVTGGFDGTETTAEAAVRYAERRLTEETWISLGGFGGYVVVGFDHSIANGNGYDFAVIGNAFAGSSEPGIVCVMQDENGDGLPNDTWYELCGSATNMATTIHDYAITYYRPGGAGMPVQWIDNVGNSGEIDYLSQYHSQDYYYPMWIESSSYTLYGTCIESLAYDKSGNGSYWILPEQEWGYADNFSAVDCNRKGDKANNFDIDNAVDYAGNRINLDYIDFVKVYTAVNAKCGWIGENSTEVCGFYDCSMVSE